MRKLNVSNGTGKLLKVTITYQTINEDDEPVSATVEIEVQPGTVVGVKQGDWELAAMSVRMAAKAGDQEYTKFAENDLVLTPEKEGYVAPNMQAMTVAYR